uniref:YqaJ viral recombinase domain-containing protein n=1 Tax=viral metagenome TaxID=1070528 RepID=A0A6C0I4U6_9ZZZZ
MSSDSEYLPNSSGSEGEEKEVDDNYFGFDVHRKPMKQNLLENLSESEISDITSDIYDQILEEEENHVLHISKPTFYDDIKKKVTETLFESWSTAGLFDEEDDVYQDIEDFVDETVEVYFDTISRLPKRSIREHEKPITNNSNELSAIEDKLHYLLSVDQPKQRSQEWYDFRNNLITASNLWKIFSSDAQKNSLIYEKCKCIANQTPTTQIDSKDFCNVDSPMHWGVKYEPVTVMIYESVYQTKISDFGCIQHPVYSCIGASPDGINTCPTNERYGRMLEIKNIKNRDITGIPKEEYWIQTQIQMETCELDECDFVETRIMEFDTEEEFYADTKSDYKGVVLYFLQKDAKQPSYVYMPLELGNEKEIVDDWISATKSEYRLDGLVLFSILYWYLDEFSCILIPRNRAWFQAAVPHILETWDTILEERVSGYEHRSAKKRSITVTAGSDSSNSYIVNNIQLTNSICLIKLDTEDA